MTQVCADVPGARSPAKGYKTGAGRRPVTVQATFFARYGTLQDSLANGVPLENSQNKLRGFVGSIVSRFRQA
jgi:hypothetical protein